MDSILDLVAALPVDPLIVASVIVFMATTMIALGVMIAVRARGEVRRRISSGVGEAKGAGANTVRQAGRKAAEKLAAYADRHFSTSDKGEIRQLRRRLEEAGFFDSRAGAFYFLARVACAGAFAAAAFVLVPVLMSEIGQAFWPLVWGAAITGYLAPKIYLDRRIAGRRNEHRAGFPDFMDLLVVCANAGLSMEAALERVGRELGDSYPSLTTNVYLATLELRAGRTMSEALESFAARLGLEEAGALAALLHQSEELGSSISDALKIYSDDMRHKRMSLAEEKAYSLPAKLSVPLMLCVFPVIIIVIMLPVFIRIRYGTY